MGTIRGGLESAGYKESSPEAQEANAEKQRVLSLLLNPKNNFRIVRDVNYTPEADLRFQPENLNKKPFREILYEDWLKLVNENKATQKFADKDAESKWYSDFEYQWLGNHTKEQLLGYIQGWIDVQEDEQVKNRLYEYKQSFNETIDRYEKLQNVKKNTERKTETDPNKQTKKFIGAKPGFRNPNANKWYEGFERMDEQRFTKAIDQFKLIINKDFGGDYKKFLDSGTFTPVANKAELGLTIAINVVAKEALLNKGKTAEFEEYKKFVELPKEKQVEFFNEIGDYVEGKTVLALIIKRLKLLLEIKTPKPKKIESKPVQIQPQKLEGLKSQESAVIMDYGFKPSPGLNKIIHRVREEFVDSDFDPDSEIGVI